MPIKISCAYCNWEIAEIQFYCSIVITNPANNKVKEPVGDDKMLKIEPSDAKAISNLWNNAP